MLSSHTPHWLLQGETCSNDDSCLFFFLCGFILRYPGIDYSRLSWIVTVIWMIKSASRCRLYSDICSDCTLASRRDFLGMSCLVNEKTFKVSCCSSEESCQCTQHASHVLEITHLSTQKYIDRGRCHKHRQQNTANINLYYIYQL